VRFGTVTDPENLRAGAKPGTDAEGSGHGHSGPSPHYFVEDPAKRQFLASQLDVARKAAMALPTAAAAKAAGYRQVTPYVPLIGAHWMNFDYVDGTFEPDKPEMVLYDGNGPDAKVVGLSYYALTTPEAPPEGFVSPNDSWHQHIGLCIANGRVVGDVDTSTADCKARGGEKVKLDNAWMNHAWVVPGWESAWGTFSAENPDLR
jgi:hypothetical protein